MKRLTLIGSWKRLGVQAGLLGGVGLAFIGGTEPPPVEAAPICQMEGQCTFVKPLFMIIGDYSTSMNTQFAPMQTRWQAAVSAVQTIIDDQNGYLQGNVILGLMRFGHDPNAGQMGTFIPNDASKPPITDGQALDVPFYNAADPMKAYYNCNGEAIKKAWDPNMGGTVPPPINGNLVGIGTWTKGALDFAYAYIKQTWADHPNDKQKRAGAVILMTDGEWTDPTGTMKLQPANQDPALTAGTMFNTDAIPTYVVALGDANGKNFADQLAKAGGTNAAIDAMNPQQLVMALQQVVEDIKQNVIQPVCLPGLPRIMVLLDASSSMLNIMGGTQAGKMDETGWDQARAALADSNMSLFDQIVNGNQKVENLVHLGLAVFGHNMPAPGEQKLLVDYGPCMKDNFAWALDPNTSCKAPGCNNPWSGPPITWTFQDGQMLMPPGFDAKTLSHMPKCDKSAQLPNACVGSGTYTHLGLQLVDQNITAYKAKCADPMFPYPCSPMTKYINILVTDGVYNSTDAQVQTGLEGMFNKGIKTYVIAFGDLLNTPDAMTKLTNMAKWGSGGMEPYYKAADQMQLQMALAAIIEEVQFDPCCSFNNCKNNPEPTTGEADPFCGDGMLNGGEACDDGNNTPGDGCEPDCTLPPLCSNGAIDPGEECDDGNKTPGDGCDAGCQLECGNGVVDGSEECDDGNDVDDDECKNDCTKPAVCGDGMIGGSEQCDNGPDVPDDNCEANCTLSPMCGDGLMGGSEECDDGNVMDGDGCSATCTIEPFCGDGMVNQPDEECDNGPDVPDDDCDATCKTVMTPPPGCGDGMVDMAAGEECDDSNQVGSDGCSATCKNEVCGNGIVDPGEACDDPDRNVCNADCTPAEICVTGGPGCETSSTSDGSSGSSGDTDSGGGSTEDTCGCVVPQDEKGQARGLLASLFTLGLAGFIRRRRRSA